ncbi:hypothetical protein QWY90_02760 [Flavobacterium paronense]|uniref:Outer membrane protein beta-barrel domain-containing protein n=1 Tax=Flavobacterium paronense TaxID=1392775 RepID=A0ABV5GCV1_9FLAO|nr:hypothetical protein [Flavobacterium paronense]MDN3676227.1 hypothetical protein [Flavobacterium paronense]
MENRKDIGKAISDKLNSLDKTPKEQVWSGINYELQKEKKRRIGFFFFWGKMLGLLLIVSIAGLYIYNQNGGFTSNSPRNSKESSNENSSNGKTYTADSDDENSKIIRSENNIKSDASIDDENATESKNSINNKNTINEKNAADKTNAANSITENVLLKSAKKDNANSISSKAGKNKTNLFSKAKSKKTDRKLTKRFRNEAKKENANLDSNKNKINKANDVQIDLSSLQNNNLGDLTSEIRTKKTDSIAKKKKEKTITINMYPKDSIKKDSAKIYKKFYADVFASPTMYGYFSKGSSLDRRLDSLTKKSEIKFSYGIGLTYDLTENVSVRIGYSKVNISYVTKNAPVNTNNYSGISYNPNISNGTIYGASNGSDKMDITQEISYTEIPLEVKYKFLDKKIGLKSSFGFSYLLLDENKISIKTDNGFSQEIGKTKNLSGTSLAVNLGLEMDYPLFKNTKIFVEPLLNYQIKAFSNSDFKPFLFGIHTGIRYSFNNK